MPLHLKSDFTLKLSHKEREQVVCALVQWGETQSMTASTHAEAVEVVETINRVLVALAAAPLPVPTE